MALTKFAPFAAAAALALTFLTGTAQASNDYEIDVSDSIAPGEYVTYKGVFPGGWDSFAEISCDGRSDLDLRVYDENGYLVVESTSIYCDDAAYWQPSWTGDFYIEVYNAGALPVRFDLIAN